ncbi:anion permease [Desulfosarcina sp. OttesenSCG-928-A07]|nr:anion permease [Desulfosarcina sp. OttesenSCG-928-G17]MDL2329123.1 anion permease [Desulfosarcina sp. OttesenSCG-928-A07]
MSYGNNALFETPKHRHGSWKNRAGYKPLYFIIAAVAFIFFVMMPPARSMVDMVKAENPLGYQLAKDTKTITDTVNQKLRPEAYQVKQAERENSTRPEATKPLLTHYQVAQMAKLTICILFLTAFLWGTEALPLGATNILVGVLLYLFAILPVTEISKAYMADAVFFIFGIFVVAVGVAKTGLDRRIGLILLSHIRSAAAFAFIFLPLLAISVSFLSEHALVALLVPVLMGVYKVTCKLYGVKKDRALAIFLILGVCFAINHGRPGSPAAGGQNAIMVGYLTDYGAPISFLQWMMAGMPFVPIMAWAVGLFMYLRLKPKFQVKGLDPGKVVRGELANMPKLRNQELAMAIILVLLVAAWLITGPYAGLGGPTLCAVMAMFVFRITTWDDIQSGVAFDVVGLYAAACAMGTALKFTGGALWLASSVVSFLPFFLTEGEGLLIGVSLVTGTLTNLMSDGTTVAVLGPVVVPMATLSDISVWKMGLVTSFSASFANILIVGTPNNAICFGMARDPETGERLLKVMDFVRYGLPVTLLAFLILWFWTVLGYWQLLNWPW